MIVAANSPSPPPASSSSMGRRRILGLILKCLVLVSPIIPLVSVFLFFWIPLNLQDRFYVDEHGFPISGLQYASYEKMHPNNRRNLQLESSSSSFQSLSPCFDYAVRYSSEESSTADSAPIVIAFASNTTLDRLLASELFEHRINSPIIAPAMPATMIVVIAKERSCFLSDNNNNNNNNKNKKNRNFAKNILNDIQRLQNRNSSLTTESSLFSTGGHLRLLTIVDTKNPHFYQQKQHQSRNFWAQSPPVADFCLNVRSGESLMPNLDAVVMHARMGVGKHGSHLHHVRNPLKELPGFPTLLPACFPVSPSERALWWVAPIATYLQTLGGLTQELFPISIVADIKNWILDGLFPAGLRYYINDLLSSMFYTTVKSTEENDPVQQVMRQVRDSYGTPVIVLGSTIDPNYISRVQQQEPSQLQARFATIIDGLFLGAYSFGFIHERLHHSHVGYLFASPDHFISVNQLQLIVFTWMIFVGLFQVMFRILQFHASYFSGSNIAGAHASERLEKIISRTVRTIFASRKNRRKYSEEQEEELIKKEIRVSKARIAHFHQEQEESKTYCFLSALFLVAVLILAPSFLSSPSSSSSKIIIITFYHPVVGILVAQLLQFLDRRVGIVVKLLASPMCGSGITWILALNFPLALALILPLSFCQSFSLGASTFAKYAFDFETANLMEYLGVGDRVGDRRQQQSAPDDEDEELVRILVEAADDEDDEKNNEPSKLKFAATKKSFGKKLFETIVDVSGFVCRCATIMLAMLSFLIVLSPIFDVELNESNISSYLIGPVVTLGAATMWWF